MRKLIAGSLVAGMLIVPAIAQEVSVYINNERMVFDQNPIIENGRTLVPLRSIFEGLGAEVKWNPDIQEIRGIGNGKEIVLRIGDTTATVNDQTIELDIAAKIENGRTLVPLRFISESLGTEVKWNAEEYRIDIENEKYEMIGMVGEGWIPVKKSGKWGYIDLKGNEVLSIPDYTFAYPFSDGLALVSSNNQWGYIDKNGKEVIPCIYNGHLFMDTSFFKNGVAQVDIAGEIIYIDKTGKEINYQESNTPDLPSIKEKEDLEISCVNDKYGYVDGNGNEIIPHIYDFANNFSEGIAAVKKDNKWGCIDKEGNIVIPFVYEQSFDNIH